MRLPRPLGMASALGVAAGVATHSRYRREMKQTIARLLRHMLALPTASEAAPA